MAHTPLHRTSKGFKMAWKARQYDFYYEQIKKASIEARAARLAVANSPEYQAQIKVNNEKYNEARSNLTHKIAQAEESCKVLCDKIYMALSLITDPKDIPKALNDFKDDLNELKADSEQLISVKTKLIPSFSSNYYDNLFITLSKNTLPEFLLYLDAKALTKPALPYHKLDRDGLIAMERKINKERPELLSDQKFLEKYGFLLPSSTSRITLENQLLNSEQAENRLLSNLIRFPENYNLCNERLKRSIFQDPAYYKKLLSTNRELIKFMPLKDIDLLAEIYPKAVGMALYFHPEVLSRIADEDPMFFSNPKHSPNVVFLNNQEIVINGVKTRISKDAYAEKLGDYAKLFLELEVYLNLTDLKYCSVKPQKQTERQNLDLLKQIKSKKDSTIEL